MFCHSCPRPSNIVQAWQILRGNILRFYNIFIGLWEHCDISLKIFFGWEFSVFELFVSWAEPLSTFLPRGLGRLVWQTLACSGFSPEEGMFLLVLWEITKNVVDDDDGEDISPDGFHWKETPRWVQILRQLLLSLLSQCRTAEEHLQNHASRFLLNKWFLPFEWPQQQNSCNLSKAFAPLSTQSSPAWSRWTLERSANNCIKFQLWL